MSDKPKPPLVHLGMFETAELIQELSNRKNFEFVIGVRFTDGSSNADPDTVYCNARLCDGSSLDFAEAIDEYLEEITLGDHEEADDEG